MTETVITPFQTCGPLFGFALFPEGLNQAHTSTAAQTITVQGVVYDGAGEPVGYGSFVEIWSSGQTTRARTLEGSYCVTMSRPAREPSSNATATSAPCLNILVFTRGLARPLLTRVYFPDEEEANAHDHVLGVVEPALRERLIAAPGGSAGTFIHDIHLQGSKESVFFAIEEP